MEYIESRIFVIAKPHRIDINLSVSFSFAILPFHSSLHHFPNQNIVLYSASNSSHFSRFHQQNSAVQYQRERFLSKICNKSFMGSTSFQPIYITRLAESSINWLYLLKRTEVQSSLFESEPKLVVGIGTSILLQEKKPKHSWAFTPEFGTTRLTKQWFLWRSLIFVRHFFNSVAL